MITEPIVIVYGINESNLRIYQYNMGCKLVIHAESQVTTWIVLDQEQTKRLIDNLEQRFPIN